MRHQLLLAAPDLVQLPRETSNATSPQPRTHARVRDVFVLLRLISKTTANASQIPTFPKTMHLSGKSTAHRALVMFDPSETTILSCVTAPLAIHGRRVFFCQKCCARWLNDILDRLKTYVLIQLDHVVPARPVLPTFFLTVSRADVSTADWHSINNKESPSRSTSLLRHSPPATK